MELDGAIDEMILGAGYQTINLFKNNRKNDIETVKQYSAFVSHFESDEMAQNLTWSGSALKNSCDRYLRQKINEKLREVQGLYHTGPT